MYGPLVIAPRQLHFQPPEFVTFLGFIFKSADFRKTADTRQLILTKLWNVDVQTSFYFPFLIFNQFLGSRKQEAFFQILCSFLDVVLNKIMLYSAVMVSFVTSYAGFVPEIHSGKLLCHISLSTGSLAVLIICLLRTHPDFSSDLLVVKPQHHILKIISNFLVICSFDSTSSVLVTFHTKIPT